MPAPWRISDFRITSDRTLWVRFHDRSEGNVDLTGLLDGERPGVFQTLRDPALFYQATLVHGAVTWPGELDLAPDVMHERIRLNGICRF